MASLVTGTHPNLRSVTAVRRWLAIRTSFVWAFALASAALGAQETAKPTLPLRTLLTAHEAHSLPPEEAARAYPVHLRAVVTYYDPYIDSRHAALFVHDATGSIFIAVPSLPLLPISAGAVLDIKGRTDIGDYAPIVRPSQITVVGQSHVPEEAPQVTMAQLTSGAVDGQWIEVEGLIHAVRLTPTNVTFELATLGGPVSATTPLQAGPNYESFVDSLVTIHANSAPVFNRTSQMVGVHLYFPGLDQVKVIQAAPADPFALPVVSIHDLLRYTPNVQLRHRMHLQGTVTLQWPGQILCIQHASEGLCMQTAQFTPAKTGDRVDVVGFPIPSDYKATLENATFRVAASGAAPSPASITAVQAFQGDHDGELVTIDGVLVDEDRATANPTLFLRSGNSFIAVLLPTAVAGIENLPWQDGSLLRVTGICSIKIDAQGSTQLEGAVRTQSVRLLLRSPEDIAVLRQPSWWTPRHALFTVAIVVLFTIAAIFWIVLLRRRVRQQTQVIRSNEERLRHMAEHDPLTDLPNRTLFYDRLNVALERVRRFKTTLAVLMVDLDRFKEVNDSLGHHAGDQLLCQVAQRIGASVRKTDTVARIGGDEFIVLLPDLQTRNDAEQIAAMVVSSLSKPFDFGNLRASVSVSVGVCTYPDGGTDATTLLQGADAAMYQAKAQGRNGYRVFTPNMSSAAWQSAQHHF
jgi:diguanylate cyclase (GGDEF)-like protein